MHACALLLGLLKRNFEQVVGVALGGDEISEPPGAVARNDVLADGVVAGDCDAHLVEPDALGLLEREPEQRLAVTPAAMSRGYLVVDVIGRLERQVRVVAGTVADLTEADDVAGVVDQVEGAGRQAARCAAVPELRWRHGSLLRWWAWA